MTRPARRPAGTPIEIHPAAPWRRRRIQIEFVEVPGAVIYRALIVSCKTIMKL
jgi:hypothetical protein